VAQTETSVPWLQWLSIALLLLAGIVGLGLSLCGGFFLFASFSEPSGMAGIAGLAAACLAVGLAVLYFSVRQIRAIARDPVDGGGAALPSEVKRAAWFAVANFILTGVWFFLPLIVSFLRRRRWARPLIAALIAAKWFGLFGLIYRPYTGWMPLMYFGLPIVILDVAALVTLFSSGVSAWLREGARTGRHA
jgi:hypothetical protein